jgi:hypothetical protein
MNWDTKLGATYLRSPSRVRFEANEAAKQGTSLSVKEKALDRLSMLDGGRQERRVLPCQPQKELEEAWWMQGEDSTQILWNVALGHVANVTASKIVMLGEDMLPPPYGAGYVLDTQAHPLDEAPEGGQRIVFKVDSGCEPWCIISRKAVREANLKPFRARSELKLADCDTIVRSEEMVRFTLRVTIGDRPRLFQMKCVVWERSAVEYDLLVSQTVAVSTGLSLFVHDNSLREVILGKQALYEKPRHDPLVNASGVVASICEDEEEDEDLMARISPLESVRQALKAPELTGDPWIDAELRGPLKEVFGPLPLTPAEVPPLEFDVDVASVKQRTYGRTKPKKLGGASPRQTDVMSAQFKELKEAGIMADAYPDYPPGPIASIAFTVAKPGTTRVPRPKDYNSLHPLSTSLSAMHEEYTRSLTAERLVVNLSPVNEVCVVQNYPLPSVQANLVKLCKFKFFAKIDLRKAFWSIPLHPRCIKWTYTIAAGGLCGVWLRAPMGLSPVPGYFTYVLQGVLKEQEDFTFIYADDILVGADSEEQLRINIRKVLQALLDKNFRVSADKCQFQPQAEITYLGWIISEGKIRPMQKTLDKLFDLKKPCDMLAKDDKSRIQAVRRFLGVVQYLGHYIPCHAEELRPLYTLTKIPVPVKGFGADYAPAVPDSKVPTTKVKFKWTQEADAAWDWAVRRMREIVPLHAPTYLPHTWLEVISDASKEGWGGILVEFRLGDPKPYIICCVAGTFSKSQLNWPTITKEMFGVWSTVRRLKHYLALHPFVLSMDHRNLLWSAMSENDMVQRLATDLQRYRFSMRHISGPCNVLCDYLSRAQYSSEEEIQRLQRHHIEVASASVVAQQQHEGGCQEISVFEDSDSDELIFKPKSGSVDHFCNDSDSGTSADSLLGKFDFRLGPGFTSDSEELSDSSTSTVHVGVAAPIQGAEQPQVPPMLPHVRLGEPHARPRRRHRIRRQPEPVVDPEGEDDGLPIPHIGPHPQPLPRRLTPQQYHIMKSFHGGTSPHTGVAALLQSLKDAGHEWEGIEQDAREFVMRCHYCQLERITRRGPASFPYASVQILPRSLMDVWHFDVLGPLPPCALTGARYILLAVEDCAKFVFVGRAMECSVSEIMLFLLDCFKIFGLPGIIKTDKGGQFLSKAIDQFCAMTGVEHVVGVAHYHESDAVVENGAALVWPYLRIMGAELKKFHAWSPLLCNVMLGANSLARSVLGGASASDIVFGRKIRPLRFVRPDALGTQPSEPVLLNKFMADQAALQLRLIGRAEAERHRRFRINTENAEVAADGQEHLDWVRVGQLVCIPQPDTQHFNRPNKFAFLRRGPYEVVELRTTTVMLRDHTAAALNRNPKPFAWPKYQLVPYYQQGDILPVIEHVVPPADVAAPEMVSPAVMPRSVSAVISHERLDPPVVLNSPSHVRNQRYMVRWQDRPHSENVLLDYDAVWQSPAFEEFVKGSELIGHVPVAQAMSRHVQQVQHLLAGSRQPNVDLPVHNPEVQVQVLRDYFPMSAPQRPSAEGVARAQSFPPLRLAVEAQPVLNEPVILDIIQQNDNPSSEMVRRSSRPNRGRRSERLE